MAGHLFVLALVFPHAVSAADFNFNLKTVLTNLHPDVASIKVKCWARSDPTAGGVDIVGWGTTEEKVPKSGEINKTIQVKFNARNRKNPASAKTFDCELIFLSLQRPDAEPLAANSSGCTNAVNEFLCAKEGTAFNSIIEGSLSGGSTDSSNGGVGSRSGGKSSGGVDPRRRTNSLPEFK